MAHIHKARNPELWVPGRQPQGYVRVDMMHPRSRDLRGFWVCNGMRAIRDLTGQAPEIIDLTGGVTVPANFSAGARGIRFGSTSVGEHGRIVDDVALRPTAAMTWVWSGTVYSGSYLWGTEHATNGWGIYNAATGARMYIRSSSSWIDPGSIGALSGDVDLAWTYNAGTFRTYLNGVFQNTGTAGSAITHGTLGIAFGVRNPGDAVSGRRSASETYYCGIWARALSDAEISDMARAPYEHLLPRG